MYYSNKIVKLYLLNCLVWKKGGTLLLETRRGSTVPQERLTTRKNIDASEKGYAVNELANYNSHAVPYFISSDAMPINMLYVKLSTRCP